MIFPEGCLAFAHRGASAHAPENTIAAFELADERGAHGSEYGVQITADGKLIVQHDRELGRVEDATGRLQDWRFDDLRALDVGSWFGSRFAGERMPTPDEVVEAVGDRLLFNFELINESLNLNGVERGVMELFRRHDLFDRAMISSFNPLVLWQVKRLEPRITLGALWGDFEPWLLRSSWWRRVLRPAALHPQMTLVTPELIAKVHARGQRIHVWTVNEPADIARLVAMGVDMLMGDYPERLGQAAKT
ncbi:MAG: hypothetical protein J5I90_10835 [Caldilineales bacterium]|nr:hypothetical protein [Caldilineales bacterium]